MSPIGDRRYKGSLSPSDKGDQLRLNRFSWAMTDGHRGEKLNDNKMK